jgi:AAA domain/UvrD-like helicase C-terminal domain
MQELLDIFEIATPGFKKGALARSYNGKLASFLHVLCHLLQIKEAAAKIIIKRDDEACGRLVPIKLIGLRKTHPMGDASMIAAALVAIKSSRVACVVEKLPARFFEMAAGCLENPKSCLENSASESLWEEFTKPFNDVHGSEIAPEKVADFSVKTISEDILEKFAKKRKEDAREFCECICEAIPQSIGQAEYNRFVGFGRKQATQLLKTPYVKLKKNDYNYYLADQNGYTGDMTENEKIVWKKAFEIAWKKVKKSKKTIIGLSLRDTIAESLPPRAKILVARFYFIVDMWWKDIEVGKRRLWLTVSDARISFGTFLDTGSHEMRSRMIKKIPSKEFFPGCLFGNNKIAEDFPRLYLKTMCPGFVQSSITYAYEKFLAAAIKRMISSPSTIEKKMEKTKSRVHPELFARLADTRDSVAKTLENPDTYQKAAEQLGQLDEEQEKAINFSGNFQIICGGPGSGKTLVLIRLAQRFAEKYPPIKLLPDKVLPRIQIVAPTHKALQVIKTRFSKEKVPHDVVEFNTCARVAMPGFQCKAKVLIVDECGMVGTKLLYSVLLNVNPKIVCLFGDPNQLPPIDIGNPFGSLLQAATVPRVKLLRNYRQEGRGIHHVVKGVLEGEWRGGNAEVALNPKSILRMGYNELRRYMNPLPKMLVSPTNRVVDFLNNAIYTLNYKSPLRNGNRVLIVDPFSPDYRIGTITSLHGPDSDALVSLDGTNAPENFPQCMLRALPYAVGQKLSLAKMHTGMRLRFIQKCGDDADIIQPNTLATCMETPGELRFPMERKPKCAQCARGVECAKHDEIKIKIDGELCERPVRLDCLALGWAYTVHKSQGSEEDDVMFVVAERDESWCDRSLVYVALSRAKKSLRINGSDSQLRQMVARPPQKPCDLIAVRVL